MEELFSIKLSFKRDELLYDVANMAFVEADIMKPDEEHNKHQVFDIAESGNVDRVTRILNVAHAECVEMLYPYTKTELVTSIETLNDILESPEEYVIELSLPSSFSMTTVLLLKDMIHEYLVCRVLADWFSVTKSESEQNWEKKYMLLRDKIKTSLTSRRKGVRRKLRPF